MIRLYGPVLLGLALIGLWLYGIIDVVTADRSAVRSLPKAVWLPMVVLVPVIGSVAWLMVGRPVSAAVPVADSRYRPAPRPLGLEDRPEWDDIRRRDSDSDPT